MIKQIVDELIATNSDNDPVWSNGELTAVTAAHTSRINLEIMMDMVKDLKEKIFGEGVLARDKAEDITTYFNKVTKHRKKIEKKVGAINDIFRKYMDTDMSRQTPDNLFTTYMKERVCGNRAAAVTLIDMLYRSKDTLGIDKLNETVYDCILEYIMAEKLVRPANEFIVDESYFERYCSVNNMLMFNIGDLTEGDNKRIHLVSEDLQLSRSDGRSRDYYNLQAYFYDNNISLSDFLSLYADTSSDGEGNAFVVMDNERNWILKIPVQYENDCLGKIGDTRPSLLIREGSQANEVHFVLGSSVSNGTWYPFVHTIALSNIVTTSTVVCSPGQGITFRGDTADSYIHNSGSLGDYSSIATVGVHEFMNSFIRKDHALEDLISVVVQLVMNPTTAFVTKSIDSNTGSSSEDAIVLGRNLNIDIRNNIVKVVMAALMCPMHDGDEGFTEGADITEVAKMAGMSVDDTIQYLAMFGEAFGQSFYTNTKSSGDRQNASCFLLETLKQSSYDPKFLNKYAKAIEADITALLLRIYRTEEWSTETDKPGVRCLTPIGRDEVLRYILRINPVSAMLVTDVSKTIIRTFLMLYTDILTSVMFIIGHKAAIYSGYWFESRHNYNVKIVYGLSNNLIHAVYNRKIKAVDSLDLNIALTAVQVTNIANVSPSSSGGRRPYPSPYVFSNIEKSLKTTLNTLKEIKNKATARFDEDDSSIQYIKEIPDIGSRKILYMLDTDAINVFSPGFPAIFNKTARADLEKMFSKVRHKVEDYYYVISGRRPLVSEEYMPVALPDETVEENIYFSIPNKEKENGSLTNLSFSANSINDMSMLSLDARNELVKRGVDYKHMLWYVEKNNGLVEPTLWGEWPEEGSHMREVFYDDVMECGLIPKGTICVPSSRHTLISNEQKSRGIPICMYSDTGRRREHETMTSTGNRMTLSPVSTIIKNDAGMNMALLIPCNRSTSMLQYSSSMSQRSCQPFIWKLGDSSEDTSSIIWMLSGRLNYSPLDVWRLVNSQNTRIEDSPYVARYSITEYPDRFNYRYVIKQSQRWDSTKYPNYRLMGITDSVYGASSADPKSILSSATSGYSCLAFTGFLMQNKAVLNQYHTKAAIKETEEAYIKLFQLKEHRILNIKGYSDPEKEDWVSNMLDIMNGSTYDTDESKNRAIRSEITQFRVATLQLSKYLSMAMATFIDTEDINRSLNLYMDPYIQGSRKITRTARAKFLAYMIAALHNPGNWGYPKLADIMAEYSETPETPSFVKGELSLVFGDARKVLTKTKISEAVAELRKQKRAYAKAYKETMRVISEDKALVRNMCRIEGSGLLEEEESLKSMLDNGTVLGARLMVSNSDEGNHHILDIADGDINKALHIIKSDYQKINLGVKLPPVYIWCGAFIYSIGDIYLLIYDIMNPSNMQPKFYAKNTLERRWSFHSVLADKLSDAQSSTSHFHEVDAVHVRHHEPCMGTLKYLLEEAANYGDITSYIKFCISYLYTVNLDSDAYGKIINMYPCVPATMHNVVKYGVLTKSRLAERPCLWTGSKRLRTYNDMDIIAPVWQIDNSLFKALWEEAKEKLDNNRFEGSDMSAQDLMDLVHEITVTYKGKSNMYSSTVDNLILLFNYALSRKYTSPKTSFETDSTYYAYRNDYMPFTIQVGCLEKLPKTIEPMAQKSRRMIERAIANGSRFADIWSTEARCKDEYLIKASCLDI